MQSIVHEPTFTSNFNKIRVFHDLQMVRNRNDFGIQKFRDIADSQFPVPKRIKNFQPMRVTECLQSLCTKFSVKHLL